MKKYDLIVVGAGPAGLSAAIEAAKRGLHVIVFDENEKPGGQLFKQIHKFFGSREHKAKIRGLNIGTQLLEEAGACGVVVALNSTVMGLYQDKEVVIKTGDAIAHVKGDAVIIATGAAENMVTFPGWTLPGVIGAGAAQTMMNLHGVKPGSRILMLGSGNVGLVVSFQLMQCGCEVAAIVDAAPKVGGYGVHAAKVARTGVPFYLSHTIVKAEGEEKVEGVIISGLSKERRSTLMWIRSVLRSVFPRCPSCSRWPVRLWRIIPNAEDRYRSVIRMGERRCRAFSWQGMCPVSRRLPRP